MKFGTLAFTQRHERSTEERSLVRRLDIFLMTFGCVSQGEHFFGGAAITVSRLMDCTLFQSSSVSFRRVLEFYDLSELRLMRIIDLDQQNISNAYVSGMKEDLHLEGNELN
jgi:hypothetical protein